MRKQILSLLFLFALLLTGVPSVFADDITGVWIMLDDQTNEPSAYVLMYAYNGKIHGRMLALIEHDTGLVEDNIILQKEKSTGIQGNPPICGMDFIYDIEKRGNEWRGTMIDPDRGKVYNCTIKRDGNRLSVRLTLRGILSFLGVNQIWMPAYSPYQLDVIIPEARTLIPHIPK